MPRTARHTSIPGYVTVALAVVTVVALPFVAHFVDGSADEFTGGHFHVAVAAGWLVIALLVAVVVTRRLQISINVEEGSALAVAYDALPILLIGAWIVAVAATLTGHLLLACLAWALCAYHLLLVVPRLIAGRMPRWVRSAPKFDVVVANVFIDNETPLDAARQLIAAAADIVVIVESTSRFMGVFDEAGGADTYPFRVWDPDDDTDYAVTLATSHELGPRSLMTRIGPLRLAIADISVHGVSVLVVALNPMATVDPGGHMKWKEQIEALEEFVPTLSGPVLIAGDLNTTRYRPEFEQILGLGLSDAIDSLGKGLNPSFKLGADGVLGSIGPVARLDHALVNQSMHAVRVENLEPCGSDHLPFKLTVAVRPTNEHERRPKTMPTEVTPSSDAGTNSAASIRPAATDG
ncbi:MAG: endonuclease/exonuclease/phosphatase family protein [Ilumatobacteraceae bacterium]